MLRDSGYGGVLYKGEREGVQTSYGAWFCPIQRILKNNVDNRIVMAFGYRDLEEAIVSAVRDGVSGKEIGVAFSGGLDSGLVSALAKRFARSVHLYTCGTSNAYDVVMARDLSERLGLPWTHVQLSRGNIERYIHDMISATGTSDPFTVSYELQLFSVCEAATEDIVLTGQGSDEYFMGCAKFVGQSRDNFEALKDASVERLLDVSVPCEMKIAEHFGKTLVYPYLDPRVTSEVGRIDPEALIPRDMDSRKSVLKEVALHLGYPCLLERKKKSSQYGSGTTDLVRAVSREKGMMYNEYIASVYDEIFNGIPFSGRGSVINARVDSVLKEKAERIIAECGSNPSAVMDIVYRRVLKDGDLRSLK